jgi:hypothetical protein
VKILMPSRTTRPELEFERPTSTPPRTRSSSQPMLMKEHIEKAMPFPSLPIFVKWLTFIFKQVNESGEIEEAKEEFVDFEDPKIQSILQHFGKDFANEDISEISVEELEQVSLLSSFIVSIGGTSHCLFEGRGGRD